AHVQGTPIGRKADSIERFINGDFADLPVRLRIHDRDELPPLPVVIDGNVTTVRRHRHVQRKIAETDAPAGRRQTPAIREQYVASINSPRKFLSGRSQAEQYQ